MDWRSPYYQLKMRRMNIMDKKVKDTAYEVMRITFGSALILSGICSVLMGLAAFSKEAKR